MADENTEVQDEQIEQPEKQPAQLSPIEQRAMEQGWVPQDQWNGDPDDWRPAKEFVDRGELFKKIDEVKRENRNLKNALEEFGKHHAKVRETEYKRALEDLKAQKRAALHEGDADAVIEIDEKIDEVKEQQRVAQATPRVQEAEPDPVFVAWANRNTWYTNDRAMKAVADEIGREMILRGVQDKVEILKAVESGIKKEFPHKFTNPNREKAGAVEGSTSRVAARKDDSLNMSEAEKRIMENIVKTGVMTKEQYIKEYKAIKGRGA